MVNNLKTPNLEVKYEVYSKEGWNDVSPFIQQNIYRIVQELFTNSLKHSKATLIDIQISKISNQVNLVFEDNGVGYNPDNIKNRHGYSSEILERTKALNGTLSDDSRIDNGASLVFNYPVK